MNMFTLMIKEHNKTGLKYLCKTKCNDPVKYRGSGKYWKRHLKLHGNDVSTKIIFQSEDLNLFSKKALEISNQFDVVNSAEWANLIHENGLDGGIRHDNPYWLSGFRHSNVTKEKISNATRKTYQEKKLSGTYVSPWLGKKHTSESRKKISESNKKPKTKEHREAISKAQLGVKRTLSSEVKRDRELRLCNLSSKIFQCSICGKIGNAGQIGRYHKLCKLQQNFKLTKYEGTK